MQFPPNRHLHVSTEARFCVWLVAGRASGTATEWTSVGVAVGGFVAFAESVEFVGYGEHEVAGQVIVTDVVDVVCRYGA